MKKIYSSLLALLLTFAANATIHNVSIENMAFSPQTLTVEVGDTVRWTLVNGTHTVFSNANSVPAGAALIMSSTLSTPGSTYDYKVTVAGTYGYICSIHTSMTGGFVANNPSTAGISKVSKTSDLKAYPNPFKTKISIPNRNAHSIEIYSVLGEKLKTVEVNSVEKATTVDLSDFRKGVYFYSLKDETGIIETRKIIKSE